MPYHFRIYFSYISRLVSM